MNHIVIVTGSRDWADEQAIYNALDNACPSLVVEGGARGADAIARQWAKTTGTPNKTFHANWRHHGRRAGPLRNRLMLQSYPTAIVLAFPLGGPGTADCMRQARALKMQVIVCRDLLAYPHHNVGTKGWDF